MAVTILQLLLSLGGRLLSSEINLAWPRPLSLLWDCVWQCLLSWLIASGIQLCALCSED